MAVREFNTVGHYVQWDDGTGGLATVAQGAFTVVAIAKLLTVSSDGSVLDLSNAGTSRASFGHDTSNQRYLRGSFQEAGGGPTWGTGDGWVLVAWTKSSGTTTVRFHKCVLSSDTWTHQNSSSNVDNDDQTCTFASTRINNDNDFVFRGRLAAMAVYNSVLNDASIEALRDDFADWITASPIAAWKFGQLSTSDAINDEVNDADQTTLSGSSVVFGDDPPGFTGFTTEPDFPYKIADRGTAQNLTSEGSTAVDLAAGASIDATNNILIARISLDNTGGGGAATTVSVTDPRSNTWTVGDAANQDPGSAAAGISCRIAYCVPTTAYQNGDDITFNYGNNTTAKAIVIEEWANIDRSSPVAVAQTTANGASTTPSISRNPTAVDQLVYCALGIEGPSGDTYTQDNDTTDGTWSSLTSLSTTSGTAASNATIRGAYKVVTGTTAQSWDPTITNRDWAAVALVFQVAATGGQDITPAAVTVTAGAGTLSMSIGVTPAAVTVTATAGTVSLALGIAPAGPTVTATPGTMAITTTVDVTPAAVTVTATPGALTVGSPVQDITPAPVTVTAAAGTLSMSIGVTPAAVTVTAAAGTLALAIDIAPAGPTVTAAAGTVSVGLDVTPAAVTVTATPGTAALAIDIPLADPGVTVAAGTVTVVSGLAIVPEVVTVTAVPGSLAIGIDIIPAAVAVTTTVGSVELGLVVTVADPGVAATAGAVTVAGGVDLDAPGTATSVAPTVPTATANPQTVATATGVPPTVPTAGGVA